MYDLKDVDILKILRDFKAGKVKESDVISELATGAHRVIVSLENSPEHEAGIPISDLYESQVLLPLGVFVDD